jgi:predicted TIM-barrel fold metal-dependent hydrolase
MMVRSHVNRRGMVMALIALVSFAACSARESETVSDKPVSYTQTMTVAELKRMPKIDAHAHVIGIEGEEETAFFEVLQGHNIKWLTIATVGTQWDWLQNEIETAVRLLPRHSGFLAWATSFNLENWNDPDWQQQSLLQIKDGFRKGAVAVKVWKEIGMVLRDPDSSFVMIDDPRFEPIFELIESRNKTLIAHIGEPRNCWLPLDEMTVNNDRAYFAENPQYHSYLHPEIPGYWKHIQARDNVLARHPGLRVVGAHLASLEWDVDSLARRLDLYPNFAVDMGARICHFQVQDCQKVRDFFIKYQNRLLYGTDLLVDKSNDSYDLPALLEKMERTYEVDYRYFATCEEMTAPEVDGPFNGLALPREVLVKIFYENARQWFPGIGITAGS